MKGMIKKELLMVKNNYKTILLSLLIFIFYSALFEMDMPFFLPFMGLMVCISTMNYDEYNNWHAYATTFPKGRINVVKSKYLSTIVITLALTIVSIILSFIIGSDGGSLDVEDSLSTIIGELFIIIFFISLLFPLLFKFDLEKGRIAMIILVLGIFGILYFEKVIYDIPTYITNFFDSYFPIVFVILSLILLPISYCISKIIYLHREF